MKNLYISILVLTAVLMAACSSDDEIVSKQPANNDNVVTQTTTVAFETASGWESVGTTRALTDAGVKTFAVGDKIAVVYTNTSDVNDMVESAALTAADIAAGGRSAKFKVTLTDPKSSSAVTYIYPAAMANADGTPNLTALNTQNGTMATLSSTLDYAKFTGTLTKDATLPAAASLANQLAVCKFTIKRNDGATDITDAVTKLTISDGTNTYTVNRSAAASPIYVAMRPVTTGNITFTVDDGTYHYEKTVTGKTLAASNLYPITVTMPLKQTFNSTGAEQTLTIPTTGYYTLEAWGAQGGRSTNAGGNGGYSTVVYQLTAGSTLYFYCGKAGSARSSTSGGAGGWNGGGEGGDGVSDQNGGGGGGGATHIATSQIGAITANNNLFTGTLTNPLTSLTPTAKSGLLLVAGGGGGGSYYDGRAYGGVGGGEDYGLGKRATPTNTPESMYTSDRNKLTFSGSQGGVGKVGTDAVDCKGGSGGHGGGFIALNEMLDQVFSYGGCGGTGWVITTNAYSRSTIADQRSGNGMARITWYGTSHP